MVVWPTPLAWPGLVQRCVWLSCGIETLDDRRPNTHVPLHTTTAKLWSSANFFFFFFAFLCLFFLFVWISFGVGGGGVCWKKFSKRKAVFFFYCRSGWRLQDHFPVCKWQKSRNARREQNTCPDHWSEICSVSIRPCSFVSGFHQSFSCFNFAKGQIMLKKCPRMLSQ